MSDFQHPQPAAGTPASPTGLLVILVGKATRLCDVVMAGRKTYEASVDFSATSTTDDAEGERTPVTPPRTPTRADLDAVLPAFIGVIQQRPPAYSAMKVGGRRAYDLARAGKPPELPPRPVTVHFIRVDAFDWPTAKFTIDCGKGTYIRSLARDIGAALGAGGYLTALRRTAVGRWAIEQARTIDSLPGKMGQKDLLEAQSEPPAEAGGVRPS